MNPITNYRKIDQSKVNFETFARNIQRTENGCWNWVGKLSPKGYALISEKGSRLSKRRILRAHRYAFEVFRYQIPAEFCLDHLCRNRKCVNPFHLQIVTWGQNVLRGDTIYARNKAVTHCPRGHEYNLENTYLDPKGGRRCHECRRIRANAAYHKKPTMPAKWDGRNWVVNVLPL